MNLVQCVLFGLVHFLTLVCLFWSGCNCFVIVVAASLPEHAAAVLESNLYFVDIKDLKAIYVSQHISIYPKLVNDH